jgi:hypothetical protein
MRITINNNNNNNNKPVIIGTTGFVIGGLRKNLEPYQENIQ